MSAEVELQNVSIAFGNFLVFLAPQVAEKQLYYERFQVFLNHHKVKY